jgi:hypothetical protein
MNIMGLTLFEFYRRPMSEAIVCIRGSSKFYDSPYSENEMLDLCSHIVVTFAFKAEINT